MTTSNELLPCPFCGHDEPTHDEGDESAWILCTNAECGMCGPITSGPALAAAAWNRRATQPAAGEPVAWIGPLGIKYLAEFESRRDNRTVCVYASKNAEDAIPLYTAPPAAAHGEYERGFEEGKKVAAHVFALRGLTAISPGFVVDAAAHGDDGRTCRFCQKRFDSAGECGNHVDHFHHGEAEPVAHGDEEVRKDAERFDWLISNVCMGSVGFGDWWMNADEPASEWRSAIDAAMRAQAGEGESA